MPSSLSSFCCIFLMMLVNNSFAQITENFWKPIQRHQIQSKDTESNNSLPSQFSSYELTDKGLLLNTLDQAPFRFSAGANDIAVLISIPMPDGSTELFKVLESPVMTSVLADKFRNFKTYSAIGITNPNASAKLDYTSKGFHAMVFAIGKNPVFVDPVDLENNLYISYYKKHLKNNEVHFQCGVDHSHDPIPDPNEITTRNAGDCQFREYRLALACTGEYANYHDDGDDTNGRYCRRRHGCHGHQPQPGQWCF